ncbi:unnamed protein product [Camellia sinensis]
MSLDLICKDKDEAEQWFIGLKALISHGHQRKWRTESRSDGIPSEANSPRTYTRRSSPLKSSFGSGDSLALCQLRQIAQEVSQSNVTNWSRRPAVLRALSQRLSRGFNEALNGFTDEGWSMMENDGKDDVSILVNSSLDKLMGLNLTFSNGFPAVSNAVLCAKASMLLQLLEVIKLEGVGHYPEDAIMPRDMFLLQEALKKRHEESLEPGAIPLTQEQLSIEILGKKSGYLKGFGVCPKPSSSRSSVTAQAHTEVVSSLQKELESLKNLSKVQQEQIRLFIIGILLTNTFIGNGGK